MRYSLEEIEKRDATYNLIIGERSNGKTYQILLRMYKDFLATGGQGAIIRRHDRDFMGVTSAKTIFESLMHNGDGVNVIKELSDGKYEGVEAYGDAYYLTTRDANTGHLKRSSDIIAYQFALVLEQRYKGTSFPRINTILFDEFIAKGNAYLTDEFPMFTSIISTIVRSRGDVKIFMCGNTISKYNNPYFREMGLRHINEMTQGTIEVYEYGTSGMRVAVEYTDHVGEKDSDVYFAFDNPKLKMITEGAWEFDIYPHCPAKYSKDDVVFSFFITFEGQLLQGDIISLPDMIFCFIHQKTTPLHSESSDFVFTSSYDPRPNWSRNFGRSGNPLETRIANMYNNGKCFYQDNEVGEIVSSFINACRK